MICPETLNIPSCTPSTENGSVVPSVWLTRVASLLEISTPCTLTAPAEPIRVVPSVLLVWVLHSLAVSAPPATVPTIRTLKITYVGLTLAGNFRLPTVSMRLAVPPGDLVIPGRAK